VNLSLINGMPHVVENLKEQGLQNDKECKEFSFGLQVMVKQRCYEENSSLGRPNL